jgi:hypothetical protein
MALRSRHQPTPPLALLGDRLGLVLSRAMSPDTCARIAERVLAAGETHTPNFDGVQATLGLAYYTHLEEGREADYFAGAERSRARVDALAPNMAARMSALVADVVQGEVIQRPGWAGPGIHIFPAQGLVAERGGDVHFDLEGISDESLALRTPALSVVLGLQAPESGGGLRLWPHAWRPGAEEDCADSPELIPLVAGDAVVFDSYRLHQIEPFAGGVDRLTATVHALLRPDGLWETWF